MSNINIDKFILADDAGEDLEYTPSFRKLDELLQGKPEQTNAQKEVVSPAEPPAWRLAHKVAEKLLLESKDLRIATGLVRCLIATHSVMGLAQGLALIVALLEKYWQVIYPVPDEPNDFIGRVNVLAALNDKLQTLDYLRASPLVKSKSGLVLNIRVFYVAEGKLQAKNEELVLTPSQLQMAVSDIEISDIEIVKDAIHSALSSINRIIEVFKENASPEEPNFKNMRDDLQLILPYFDKAMHSIAVEVAASTEEVQKVSISHTHQSLPNAVSSQSIKSRTEVIEILEKVCLFLETTEPAHPAPLFIRRGQRLLTMDFMQIIQELSPEAYDTISHLSGKKTSDNE